MSDIINIVDDIIQDMRQRLDDPRPSNEHKASIRKALHNVEQAKKVFLGLAQTKQRRAKKSEKAG